MSTSNKHRRCVFCGAPPVSKSREHVLPQWLLQLTGNPKRNFLLGRDLVAGKDRQWPADQFQFPACEVCNTKYSELEGCTRQIFARMSSKYHLAACDITTLLGWLDKVRVGLFLGFNQLNRAAYDITPTFYIDSRIRMKDRMLHIVRIPNSADMLCVTGVSAPLFWMLPSAFAMLINDLIITNISIDYLVARSIGFPYMCNGWRDTDNRLVYAQLARGTERLTTPIVPFAPALPGLMAYQACFTPVGNRLSEWHRERMLPTGDASVPVVDLVATVSSQPYFAMGDEVLPIPAVDAEPNFLWRNAEATVLWIQNETLRLNCSQTNRSPTSNEADAARLNVEVIERLIAEDQPAPSGAPNS